MQYRLMAYPYMVARGSQEAQGLSHLILSPLVVGIVFYLIVISIFQDTLLIWELDVQQQNCKIEREYLRDRSVKRALQRKGCGYRAA